MAMKPLVPLVRVAHGSHLYGTSTPASDQDFKGVHLPSGRAILLQRAEDVVEHNVVAKQGTKNTADAIDEQSFSVQKFFTMLAKGDTVATEILFAPPLMTEPRWGQVHTIGRSLLNRQCKGFVGYCLRQAAKYGIKGSRMNTVHRLLDHLRQRIAQGDGGCKLAVMADELMRFARTEDHAGWVNLPSPPKIPGTSGEDLWHIECCDRKMPITATIRDAEKVYAKVWENYGKRARAAMRNEGIDWKALSHAVRVARQAIELLQTGAITFPRPDAAELLEIKLGLHPYAQISVMLERLVQDVHKASENSLLPATSDISQANLWVERLYREQII